MTRRQKHLVWVLFSFLGLATALALVLVAFNSILFFFSPSELIAHHIVDQNLRLGGVVANGSVQKEDKIVWFSVTDSVHEIPVIFTGILPDLFREGQGVVVEGKLRSDGVFEAIEVLAKHDETYMPRELEDSIKK